MTLYLKTITKEILGHRMLLISDEGALVFSRWLPENDEDDNDEDDIENEDGVENEENDDNAENYDNILSQAIREINEYLEGKRREFTVPITPKGTDFQMEVWDELRRIPYGETITYAELARRIGRPKAYRAVANACGANPLPIIIPCHRVVSSSGHAGGYSGPAGIKGTLILMEKTKLPVKAF